ncbi:MAG: hypothetical protein INR62_13100 [Rhodospirillales bacterium]|nr:hypothetical protein [Acetobacter sp.]
MTQRLLNGAEASPEVFYIFVNQMNPMTEHNFKLSGQFPSGAFGGLSVPEFVSKYLDGTARYLPYEPCHNDLVGASPFLAGTINSYRVEYDAEVTRERFFSLYPSRLSALYAFGDYESCERVSKIYNWPLATVRRFRLEPHPFNRVVKVNMEHVSVARHVYRSGQVDGAEGLWRSYWGGEATYNARSPGRAFTPVEVVIPTLWEYLIEGVVVHIDR